jgi:RNA polymerase sigma-70 factor (ECF subfamily)
VNQERDRTVFWLYYQQGFSAKAIAALPSIGLSEKGVESAILRLTREVRNRLATTRSEPSRGADPDPKGLRAAKSY